MFEQWLAMEQFYYNDFAVMLVIAVILAIFLVSMIFYLDHLIPKILLIVTLFSYTVMGVINYQNFTEYWPLIDKTRYENAAVRDYKRSFFNINHPYPQHEIKLYRKSHIEDTFEKLGFYEGINVEEAVTYLGSSTQNLHYFDINDRIYSVGDTWVTFSEDIDQAIRAGTRYEVMDPRFTELGFVEESRVLFEQYYVPMNAQKLMVDEDLSSQATAQFKDMVQGWAVP